MFKNRDYDEIKNKSNFYTRLKIIRKQEIEHLISLYTKFKRLYTSKIQQTITKEKGEHKRFNRKKSIRVKEDITYIKRGHDRLEGKFVRVNKIKQNIKFFVSFGTECNVEHVE